MKLKRTVACPTGCNPDSLLREHMKLPPMSSYPWGDIPHTFYFCPQCKWEAMWNWEEGLEEVRGYGPRSWNWGMWDDAYTLLCVITR